MPLYEYACESCGGRFERIQKFSDPLETTCPSCGGPVKKLISSPAIQFKGSGWYITDYARSGAAEKKPAEAASADKPAADSGEAKKSGETEKGPAPGAKSAASAAPAAPSSSTPKP